MVSIGLRRPNSNGRKIGQLVYDKVGQLSCWYLEGDRLQPILERGYPKPAYRNYGVQTGLKARHKRSAYQGFGKCFQGTFQSHGVTQRKRLTANVSAHHGSLTEASRH